MGPLANIRVIELVGLGPAPFCAMMLSDMGADVVCIERKSDTPLDFLSDADGFMARGRHKIALDLKDAKDQAHLRELLHHADVLMEGFRPGVMERLGLGPDVCLAANPRLIYLSVSGFGQVGPSSVRPCSDSVAQAFSGLVSINRGDDGIPHRVGTPISDVATGAYAFQAIGAALFARANVGTGRWIDISLTQTTAALLGHKFAEFMLEGGAPRALNVPAGTYRSKDGWLMVTLVNEPQYQRLCAALGRDDLATDPRFANFAKRSDAADVLIAEVRATLL
ncbi:MAG: CoA transferase, partial [Rhizobiales bacterium]|nr:CoA transferase [Hyphomicrobiales bacterium]